MGLKGVLECVRAEAFSLKVLRSDARLKYFGTCFTAGSVLFADPTTAIEVVFHRHVDLPSDEESVDPSDLTESECSQIQTGRVRLQDADYQSSQRLRALG